MRLILALILALLPVAANADTLARSENGLLVIQVVDAVQTQTWLHGGRYPCAAGSQAFFIPNNQPPGATCIAYEADPLARPFVGNMGRNVIAGVVVNLAVRGLDRLLFRHSRKQAGIGLAAVDAIYAAGILIPNQRIIQAQR